MLLAKGTILLESSVRPFSGASVYIRLEDVTRIDAASIVIAEQVLRGVRAGEDVRELDFAIHGDELEPHAHYVVRVHVDVDNDGKVGVGDYVSTASHPVTLNAFSKAITIPVHLV